MFPLSPHTHTHTHSRTYIVDYLTIEQGGIRDKVNMLEKKRKKNVWDGEEITQDKNREGQRARRKQRLISQMTHVWMACLMTNLQAHERATDHVITDQTTFCGHFQFWLLYHMFMLFKGLQLTGGAVQRALSPSIMFPLKSLPGLRDGSPSLDHSARQTVFQPLLPAASSDQKVQK